MINTTWSGLDIYVDYQVGVQDRAFSGSSHVNPACGGASLFNKGLTKVQTM